MLHHDLLRRLCVARECLREDSDSALNLTAIARRAGLSRFHFIRLFKAVFGVTPHHYRTCAQIERAKQLLILSDLTVTEVCMAVGFSSLGSFSSLFKRRVGLSPSAFQRRHRALAGSAREMPAALIPGCFSLMARIPPQKSNSKEAASGLR